MKMQKSTFFFLFLLANILFVAPVFAQTASTTTPTTTVPIVPMSLPTTTPTSTPPTEPPTATSTVPLLIQKIQAAKDLLNSVKLNYTIVTLSKIKKISKTKSKKSITGYTTDGEGIAVAVYDPSADSITIVQGTQHGKNFSFSDPTVSLQAGRFNGVNTPFVVTKPAGAIVIALKYLITPTSAGSKKSLLNQLHEATYVPYSDAFNQTDIYAYGNSYVDNVIQQAIAQLHDMRSQRSSGLSVASAVNPALIKSLIYSEHMDQTQLLNNPDTQGLVNKLNVLFAINDGDTFRYSASTANARGIAQFIPSTYRSLVNRYPQAHLIPDFNTGMEDHVNSITAAFLLIDDYISDVARGLGDAFDDSEAPYYGAAAYNGGTTRVIKAVKQFGANWDAGNRSSLGRLQSEVASGKASVKSLTSKYKKATKATDKKALKNTLYTAQIALNHARSDLAAIQAAALKTETVGYVAKIRKLFAVFNN